jgi:hypothetical protein
MIYHTRRIRHVKTNFFQAGKELTGFLQEIRIADYKPGTGLKEVSPIDKCLTFFRMNQGNRRIQSGGTAGITRKMVFEPLFQVSGSSGVKFS